MQKRLDYLDGMRAIAVLGVVTIHYGGFGLRSLGTIGNSIVDQGKYGVTIFFVLSAYSLCLSIDSHGKNWTDFYIRRFFRIVPLYWLVCVFVASLNAWKGEDWRELLISLASHLSFGNIIDLRHANDLIKVEWSIPVEVSFYLVFPVVFLLTVRFPALILLTGLALALPQAKEAYHFVLPFSPTLYQFRPYTLPWHLPAFLAGMLAYFWLPRISLNRGIVLLALLMLLILISLTGETPWSSNVFIGLSVLLILLCRQNVLAERIVGSRAMAFIGQISFSIYLVHYIVSPIVVEPFLSFAVTLVVSALTYLLIEQPARRLGQRFIMRRRALPPAARADEGRLV